MAAWVIRSFFAARTEERLKNERDAASVSGKTQEIRADAKAKEAALLHERQKKEDAIHAADSGSVSAGLDDMFER